MLRMDMIPACYMPPHEIHSIRDMIRQRARLARDRTKVVNRIYGLLDAHDVPLYAKKACSAKALQYLESVELENGHDKAVLGQCIRNIRYLTGEIVLIEKRLEETAAKNEDARLPAGMTGVGLFSALLLAADMIGTVSRFDGAKKMVSCAGLCPTIHQSGDRTYTGRIKRPDANLPAKWIMCESAHVAARHDPRMKAVYESALKRHASRKPPATIVVANKMNTIMWHMPKTRTPYESRNEDLYKRKLNRMDRACQKYPGAASRRDRLPSVS